MISLLQNIVRSREIVLKYFNQIQEVFLQLYGHFRGISFENKILSNFLIMTTETFSFQKPFSQVYEQFLKDLTLHTFQGMEEVKIILNLILMNDKPQINSGLIEKIIDVFDHLLIKDLFESAWDFDNVQDLFEDFETNLIFYQIFIQCGGSQFSDTQIQKVIKQYQYLMEKNGDPAYLTFNLFD